MVPFTGLRSQWDAAQNGHSFLNQAEGSVGFNPRGTREPQRELEWELNSPQRSRPDHCLPSGTFHIQVLALVLILVSPGRDVGLALILLEPCMLELRKMMPFLRILQMSSSSWLQCVLCGWNSTSRAASAQATHSWAP
jgi:hypothetical protein